MEHKNHALKVTVFAASVQYKKLELSISMSQKQALQF